MSNPWSPADPKPLPNTRKLLRTQMPNAPELLVEASLEELAPRAVVEAPPVAEASPASDEVLVRLAAAEAAATEAVAKVTALAEQVATLTGEVTALGTEVASLRAANTKLEAAAAASAVGADTADAIHKRLAALEARPAAAPARTPVPPRAASA